MLPESRSRRECLWSTSSTGARRKLSHPLTEWVQLSAVSPPQYLILSVSADAVIHQYRTLSIAVGLIAADEAILLCLLTGKSSGLPSQGEAAAGSGSNTRFRVFDENRAVSAAPEEPRLELWMAPPTSRAKENEQRPEKWSSIKVQNCLSEGGVVQKKVLKQT